MFGVLLNCVSSLESGHLEKIMSWSFLNEIFLSPTSQWFKGMLDASSLVSVPTLVLMGIATVLAFLSFRTHLTFMKHSPPVVAESWIPFFGCLFPLFGNAYGFVLKCRRKYGDCFVCHLVGLRWVFLLDKEDAERILNFPEKKASLVKGSLALGNIVFPKDLYKYPCDELKHYFTQVSTYSLSIWAKTMNAERIKRFMPIVRTTLQERLFPQVEDGSVVDLFEWCKSSIAYVTVSVLVGDDCKDSEWMDEFLRLFNEADLDTAFSDPGAMVRAAIDFSVTGERSVFRKLRKHLYPLIHKRVEALIGGEELGCDVLSTFVTGWCKKVSNEEDYVHVKVRAANDVTLFLFAALGNSYGYGKLGNMAYS